MFSTLDDDYLQPTLYMYIEFDTLLMRKYIQRIIHSPDG